MWVSSEKWRDIFFNELSTVLNISIFDDILSVVL